MIYLAISRISLEDLAAEAYLTISLEPVLQELNLVKEVPDNQAEI